MRHLRRDISASQHVTRGIILTAVVSLFILTACSLPGISIERKKKADRNDEVASFSTSYGSAKGKDKRYLATVHVRFSEAKDAAGISFDVRRDKRKMILAKLFESEETTTTMHMGYTRSDGPIVGLNLTWRF